MKYFQLLIVNFPTLFDSRTSGESARFAQSIVAMLVRSPGPGELRGGSGGRRRPCPPSSPPRTARTESWIGWNPCGIRDFRRLRKRPSRSRRPSRGRSGASRRAEARAPAPRNEGRNPARRKRKRGGGASTARECATVRLDRKTSSVSPFLRVSSSFRAAGPSSARADRDGG